MYEWINRMTVTNPEWISHCTEKWKIVRWVESRLTKMFSPLWQISTVRLSWIAQLYGYFKQLTFLKILYFTTCQKKFVICGHCRKVLTFFFSKSLVSLAIPLKQQHFYISIVACHPCIRLMSQERLLGSD